MIEKQPYQGSPGPGPVAANLTDGGSRRDYGPRGCAGIVLAPVALVAMALLRGGRR